MITYSKLGHPRRGRLGNHLFQIASTIGLARAYGHEYYFPPWPYSKYFAKPLPTGGAYNEQPLPEAAFTYQDERIHVGENHPNFMDHNYDLDGWRQSERYWIESQAEVRDVFTFEPGFYAGVAGRFLDALSRPTVAISVRRGDFVGNPNYHQIPARYYFLALLEAIPDWRAHNIIFFSDDLEWCRVHFSALPGVYFADGSDIEQLALMTMCRHFIISNSTFSWWGAWLGEKAGSVVVRPPKNFAGHLAQTNNEADYWPARWVVVDTAKRIPLHDVTFMVPVFIDHHHRLENLELSVRQLAEAFDTNIVVAEQGNHPKAAGVQKWAKYIRVPADKFHRTKMLNDMAKLASTPIVVNWDCDVFVPSVQIWLAAELIRKGADMVYPYDGQFARVPRTWHRQLSQTNDIGIFGATPFAGKYGAKMPTTSVGGAIMFNKESFLNGGGENEYMVSFGPEDWERNYRFKALGYTVDRVKGVLYHLDHWCGPNSSNRNPYFKHNHKELDEIRAMTPDQLEQYVMTWPWRP
jgi:hypothetical protein